ncbi:helix-turn-helix domain-containing protein [Zhaonella formicivorans]|uniref:helix-turn-helix domain-containing protein n=1 Tax=Zhaonella formicivorans TaxID=2528593 RepID=UPI0010CE4B07|nr:helix-turn-helix transcriptional regulator [Zhaonella formicivorans]
MDYRLLGEKIRKERLSRGLTQEVLAEKANVSVSFMGQIERGERKLSLETLIKIGNVLGLSFDYLLQDSRKTKEQPDTSGPVYIIKESGSRFPEPSAGNRPELDELVHAMQERTPQEIKIITEVAKTILKYCKNK